MATSRRAFVLDASAALQVVLPDSEAHRDHAVKMMADVMAGRRIAYVPVIFFNEVAAGCAKAIGRRRLTKADAQEFFLDLGFLPLELSIEVLPSGEWFDRAQKWGCQVGDSAYLQLALELGVPIATSDNSLSQAALREGVPVIAPTVVQ